MSKEDEMLRKRLLTSSDLKRVRRIRPEILDPVRQHVERAKYSQWASYNIIWFISMLVEAYKLQPAAGIKVPRTELGRHFFRLLGLRGKLSWARTGRIMTALEVMGYVRWEDETLWFNRSFIRLAEIRPAPILRDFEDADPPAQHLGNLMLKAGYPYQLAVDCYHYSKIYLFMGHRPNRGLLSKMMRNLFNADSIPSHRVLAVGCFLEEMGVLK